MNKVADFTNKKIIIFGASSGIGRQTAIQLNELGAGVVLVARREDKLKEIISNLEGDRNSFYSFDLTELGQIESLVRSICQEQGPVDGMVYTAGIANSMPLNMYKPEKLQQIFDINFFAFVECVRQITKKGRYNENMRIVGVSSIASFVGDKTHLGYSASKAAMDAAVRCIAKEVAAKGKCINNVAPAMIATDMHLEYMKKRGSDNENYNDNLKRQYLGMGQTRDIANAIIFLLSEEARFITGITMPIDGGYTTS